MTIADLKPIYLVGPDEVTGKEIKIPIIHRSVALETPGELAHDGKRIYLYDGHEWFDCCPVPAK